MVSNISDTRGAGNKLVKFSERADTVKETRTTAEILD
jgi:hypothetical protein